MMVKIVNHEGDEIECKIETGALYGAVKLDGCYKREGDALVYYGWSIRYDRNGIEVSRTEPKEYSRITNYAQSSLCEQKPWWRFWR